MRRHGKIITTGGYIGGRWCKVCKHAHGYLYPCQHYSEDTLNEIKVLSEKDRYNWSNPDYIKKKIEEGMPIEGVIIMQMFAGLRG